MYFNVMWFMNKARVIMYMYTLTKSISTINILINLNGANLVLFYICLEKYIVDLA